MTISPLELHHKIKGVQPAQIEQIVNHLKELTLFGDADYIVPADIQDNLEPLSQWYPDDEKTQAVLDEIWRKVKDMHSTTGKAVSWLAIQQEMIRELEMQRDAAIITADEGIYEVLADQGMMLLDALEACGCDEEEANIFLEVFCDDASTMPESAKELIRQAVQIVYDAEMEKLNHG